MLTREHITAVYEEVMDKQPPAGREVMEADDDIQTALDAYCCAIRYETFLWAYELGYEAGKASTESTPDGLENAKMIAQIVNTLQQLDPVRLHMLKVHADVLLRLAEEEHARRRT